MDTPAVSKSALNTVYLNIKVPTRYITPPNPANRSTKNPLLSSLIFYFQFPLDWLSTLSTFQDWDKTIKADPIINWFSPYTTLFISGI